MKTILALCLAAPAITAFSQEEIVVTCTGQRQISRAASEAVLASGHTPVMWVDAHRLHIVGGQSWFQLDSVRLKEWQVKAQARHTGAGKRWKAGKLGVFSCC